MKEKRMPWLKMFLAAVFVFLAPLLAGGKAEAYPYYYVYVGETITIEDDNMTNGSGYFKSWNTTSGLISISPIGVPGRETKCKVTGMKPGRADIVCTTDSISISGVGSTTTKIHEIVVLEPLEDVAFTVGSQNFNVGNESADSNDSLAMQAGETTTVKIAAVPSSSGLRSMQVTSSNTSVVSVTNATSTQAVTLTAKKNGEARITMKVNSGDGDKEYQKNYSFNVKVGPKVTSLSINKSSMEMEAGDSGYFSLRVDPVPSNAPLGTVTFTSSDPSVVRIKSSNTSHSMTGAGEHSDDAYCSLTPLKAGTAVITAEANGKSVSCRVTVKGTEPSGIRLNQTFLELTVGDSAKLSATVTPASAAGAAVTWESSEPDCVTVDSQGNVKVAAYTPYYVTITARTANGKTAECSVGMMPKIPNKVSLNKTKLTLQAGKSETLKVTLSPSPNSQYYWYWTTSDDSIVTVDQNGKITAKKKGTAKITVQAGPDKTATCTVTVGTGSSSGSSASSSDTKALAAGKTFKYRNNTYKVKKSQNNINYVSLYRLGSKKAASVSIPATVKYQGVTYRVNEIAAKVFMNCTSLRKVTIGRYVTTIGTYAFRGCKKLTSVSIPASVTKINTGAFYGCTGLKKVTLGKKVKTIGRYAFRGCTSLTSVKLPSSVTTVSQGAFYGCKRLKRLTIQSTKLKTVGKGAIKGIYKKAVIKVPKAKVKSYQKLFKSSTGFVKTMKVSK